ncbi:MAG: UbiA prenyltransferase family protein [Candidatus Aenigmarchaeota archaeon]|nr:UbiA prenyltransferase family protein [Candidatus Aenigmarchaeota archaeon]
MKINEVYKVKAWYYYLGFILLGFFMNYSFSLTLLILLLAGSFMLAYAYSFNDFWDKRKKAYFVLPLVLSILIIPFLNQTQILLALIFLFIVTIYSAKPIRLKAKPFLSSFCNGIGFSVLFLLGYSVKSLDFRGFIFFLLFFCFNMVAQFIHEIVDLKEDRKNRIITTAVFLGEDKIKTTCYTFLLIAFLLSFYLFYLEFVGFIFVLATLFFVLFFTYKIHKKKIDRRLRKEYKLFGLIVGVIYFILLFLSRIG